MAALLQQGGASSSPTFTLGKTGTGETVKVSLLDLMTGFYLIGSSGSGKTTLLVNMALQARAQGVGLCFLTPHGDAIDDILARLKPGQENNVILLDVSAETTFGLNLFQCNPKNEREVSITLNTNVELFGKLFTESGSLAREGITMFESVTAITLLLIFNQGGYTLGDVPTILSDKALALRLADNLPASHSDMKHWWKAFFDKKDEKREETVGSLRRRLLFFLSDLTSRRIFSSAQTTVNMREIMDSGKILLVKLDRQRQQLTSLVGATLVSRIALAAFSRQSIPEASRRPFMLFADEYHRFATETFAELLAEVRKFRIATVVAHQFRDQLNTANKGATLNAGNLAVFRVQGNDAEELSSMFHAASSVSSVLSANVLQTLLQEGHSNEQVVQYIQTYLRPLQSARSESETHEEDEVMGRGSKLTLPPVARFPLSAGVSCLYSHNPDEMRRQMTAFGDFLYNAVRSPTPINIPQAILTPFSFVLGFSCVYDCLLKPNPLDSPGLRNMGIDEATLFQTAAIMAIGKRIQYLQNQQQGVERVTLYRAWEFAVDGLTKKHDHAELAVLVYEREAAAYRGFVLSTKQVIAALKAEPIFASSKFGASGNSSISEAQRAIQQQLTHPPRFGFRVRLGEREYTAQALPLPAPTRSASSLTQQITQSNLRSGYVREKASADRELSSREPSSLLSPAPFPLLPSPVFQPADMQSVFVSEEEPDDIPAVPQYTPKEEAYRVLYLQVNGRYPSYIPFSEKPEERARRLCLEMNGYAPAPQLSSGQNNNVQASSRPEPPQNTRAAKPTPKQSTRKKRSKQEEEE